MQATIKSTSRIARDDFDTCKNMICFVCIGLQAYIVQHLLKQHIFQQLSRLLFAHKTSLSSTLEVDYLLDRTRAN